jgi:hypothetical protein
MAPVSRDYAAEYAAGDGYFRIKLLMERSHETLLLGLDNIKRQIDDDHTANLNNWLGYVGAWAQFVSYHHAVEEKAIFPSFKSHGIDVSVRKLSGS